MAVGSIPNTADLGLEEAGVTPRRGRVRRRSTACRARRPTASTPPATAPGCSCSRRSRRCRAGSRCGTPSARRSRRCDLKTVSANVFTDPEIATVGWSAGGGRGRRHRGAASSRCRWPRTRGPRCRASTTASSSCSAGRAPGVVVGGVVVAPRASELIFPVSLAVEQPTSPSTSSRTRSRSTRRCPARIAEAARQLHPAES